MNDIETTIINNVVLNEKYTRKVIHHLTPEYFTDESNKTIFNITNQYFLKYNALPTKEVLAIELENKTTLSGPQFDTTINAINDLQIDSSTNLDWLVSETEKYCQGKALYNAIVESISVIDGKDKRGSGILPKLFEDALAVSFDTKLGHDYLTGFDERFDFYHDDVDRIPFDLDYMNRITKGGLPRKTISCLVSGVNIGKSLVMCHMAAAHLKAGYNVLYITAEMAEERIAERIDANLMDVTIDELGTLSKEAFDRKADRVKKFCKGKLKIKEYPTASANALHVKNLLNDYKLKHNFIPDIIYLDYLNIFTSTRVKMDFGTYSYVKAIAEEFRGLAIEYNMAIMTATQAVRSAVNASDMDQADTSESFGLVATVDLLLGVMCPEEFEERGHYLFKQLKNRLNSKAKHRKFVIGVNFAKMTLFDVNEDEQRKIFDSGDNRPKQDTPIMDDSPLGGIVKTDKKKVFGDFT